ncbi:MAG: DnaJ domain-containing protein [Micrococcales bacterium]|nr:DnaJ domain-containing protein [Micrococcales bacterium]
MSDSPASRSPLSASPYAVLGVPATASGEELRRAFRRRLRETHPDAGGTAAAFTAVQAAWAAIGTPEARAAFDHGGSSDLREAREAWAPPAPRRRQDTRPVARSYGHPGGWYRERYLDLLQQWVGFGDPVPDPYDPVLVRRAPREVRGLLAAAVAEEETARRLATLGMGFTIWHDVATDAGKLDHVVLGPTGLWAAQSEDFGGPVTVRRGELQGADIPPGDAPMHEVARRARQIGRRARVRFSAVVMVVSDGEAGGAGGVQEIGAIRGIPSSLVERSRLVDVLRTGMVGVRVGGTDLFELRSRLQAAVAFA